uniref:Putative secreted protein n=1 Tax=Amblyomma tuberculatum TaxID=48802 RepID=A0A6M2E6N7_9ACAR
MSVEMNIRTVLIGSILFCAVAVANARKQDYSGQPGFYPSGVNSGNFRNGYNLNPYGYGMGRPQFGWHPRRYGWTISADGDCAVTLCPSRTHCTYKHVRCCGYRKHCWYRVACEPIRFARGNPE